MNKVPKDILIDIFLKAGPHEGRHIAPVCRTWAELIRRYIRGAAEDMVNGYPNPTPLAPLSGPFVRHYKRVPLRRAVIDLLLVPSGCPCGRVDIVGLLRSYLAPDKFDDAILQSIMPDELASDLSQLGIESPLTSPAPILSCIIWASCVNDTKMVADVFDVIIECWQNSATPELFEGAIRIIFHSIKSWKKWTPQFLKIVGTSWSWQILIQRFSHWGSVVDEREIRRYKNNQLDVYFVILIMTGQNNCPDIAKHIRRITRSAIRKFVGDKWGS